MAVVTRTNLCTNPSFEAGITGWSAGGSPAPAIAQSAVWAQSRTKSLLITWAAGNTFFPGANYTLATTPGTQYTVSAYVNVPAGNPPVQILVGGSGLFVGSNTSVTNAPGERLTVTFTATSGSHNVSLVPPNVTPTAGQFCYLDAVLIEQAPNAAAYFDGASSGCQWTGTADLSTSQQLSGPLSITVTNDLVNEPPRNTIFVTGAPGTTAQITRTDADGATRPVRGGDPAPLVGGQWVGYDYEVPYGTTVTYTVIPSDGTPNVFVAVPVLATSQARLIHPGVPSLSVKLPTWHQDSPRGSDTGEAQHIILGRKNPQIITDGQRKGYAYQGTIRSQTEQQNAAIRAILDGSVPLLLQVVYPFTGVGQWEYVSVGHVDEDRATEQFGDPRRVFRLTFTVVDRPVGGVAAQRTIADVAVEVGTVTDLAAKYATNTGLLTGIAGT